MKLLPNRSQIIKSVVLLVVVALILGYVFSKRLVGGSHWTREFGFTGRPAISQFNSQTIVGQTVRSGRPVSFLTVRFATYGKKLTGSAVVKLLADPQAPSSTMDSEKRIVAQWSLLGEKIQDNAPYKLQIPNIRFDWKQGGYLMIGVDSIAPSKPLTVWLDQSNDWSGPNADILILSSDRKNYKINPAAGHLSLAMGWDRNISLLAAWWYRPHGPWVMVFAIGILSVICFIAVRVTGSWCQKAAQRQSKSNERKKPPLKKGFVVVTLAASIITCLIGAEVILQAYHRYTTDHWLWRDNAFKINYTAPVSDRRQYALRPGYRDKLITINKEGFRVNPSAIKSDKVIICLGDSVPFGAGVTDRDTFPFFLGRLAAPKGLSVINAGVPSYNIRQSFDRLWFDILPRFPHPVLVTIQAGNDVSLLAFYRTEYDPDKTWADVRWRPRWPKPVWYKSAVLNYLDKALDRLFGDKENKSPTPGKGPHSAQQERKMLANIKLILDENISRLRKMRIPVVLLPINPFYYQTENTDLNNSLPWWHNQRERLLTHGWSKMIANFNRILKDAADRHENVVYCDLSNIFDRQDRKGLYVDWVHTSAQGAELAAQAVWRESQSMIRQEDQSGVKK